MIIEWKDPNMKLHGKRHKSDRYYFRVHYGKQRLVHLYKEYVDKPTEAQKTAREEFTERRREVARQLKDPVLRAKWEREFKADKKGYKMLHCYVYAMLAPSNSLRKGEDCTSSEGMHAEPVRGQRMKATSLSSEGAHADNADNANLQREHKISQMNAHILPCGKCCADNAEPVRGQRMKATSLSSEGAHADNADNANLQREHKISQMNAHILPCGKCCADNAENVRGQRMKAISLSSEGAHADNADNANFASWAQTHADGTRRLVKDNADGDGGFWQGLHVVVMEKDGEMRRVVISGYRYIRIPKYRDDEIPKCRSSEKQRQKNQMIFV